MIESAVGNSVSLLRNIQSNVISVRAAFDIVNNDVASYDYVFIFIFIDFLRLFRRRGRFLRFYLRFKPCGIVERQITDAFEGSFKRDIGKSSTVLKRIISDRCRFRGELERGEACTAVECMVSDCRNIVIDRNVG